MPTHQPVAKQWQSTVRALVCFNQSRLTGPDIAKSMQNQIPYNSSHIKFSPHLNWVQLQVEGEGTARLPAYQINHAPYVCGWRSIKTTFNIHTLLRFLPAQIFPLGLALINRLFCFSFISKLAISHPPHRSREDEGSEGSSCSSYCIEKCITCDHAAPTARCTQPTRRVA